MSSSSSFFPELGNKLKKYLSTRGKISPGSISLFQDRAITLDLETLYTEQWNFRVHDVGTLWMVPWEQFANNRITCACPPYWTPLLAWLCLAILSVKATNRSKDKAHHWRLPDTYLKQFQLDAKNSKQSTDPDTEHSLLCSVWTLWSIIQNGCQPILRPTVCLLWRKITNDSLAKTETGWLGCG